MGYFKELIMDNEDAFLEMIEENGIEVNGKMYYNGELLQADYPVEYFELLSEYVTSLMEEYEYDR